MGQRRRSGKARGPYARKRVNPVKNTVVERIEAFRWIAGEFWVGVDEQDMGTVKSDVFSAQILKRAQKQPGKCEQNQRE